MSTDLRTDPPQDIVAEGFAARLRGFGPVGLLAFVAISLGNMLFQPLTAVLVLVWAGLTQTPWRALGLARPRNWPAALALGAAFGIAFKLVLKALVMPLLGAEPINQAYHYLAGNTAAALLAIPMLIVYAGLGEEIYFRGFLFERLGALIGRRPAARALTVLFTSVFFGALHYHDQGLAGVEQATIVGLVFGAIYARTGRLWPLISAHAAFDLTALAIIYWELETAVAHWLFG
jgi:membrane protease YdiL (CAAX protease family)